MDLTDQRLACLRMAMELNCQTEPLLKAANELMSFIATGSSPAAESLAAKPEVSIDTIAACGTALQMPLEGGLEAAQPLHQAEPLEQRAETPEAGSDVVAEASEAAEESAPAPEAAASSATDNPDTVLSPAETSIGDETAAKAIEPDSSEPVAETSEVERTAAVGEVDVDAAVEAAAEVTSDAPADVHVTDANPEQAAAVH